MIIKEAIEKLSKASEAKQVTIYSKNHFNFFKLLYREIKGEPYKGDNIPVLEVKDGGVTYTIMSSDLMQDDLGFGEELGFI